MTDHKQKGDVMESSSIRLYSLWSPRSKNISGSNLSWGLF